MFPETCFHKCLPGGKPGREHENTCRSPNWLNEETCLSKHRGCIRSFKLALTLESGDGDGNIRSWTLDDGNMVDVEVNVVLSHHQNCCMPTAFGLGRCIPCW